MHDESEVVTAAGHLSATLLANGIEAEFEPVPEAKLRALSIDPPPSPDLLAFYACCAPVRVSLPFSPEQLELYPPRALTELQEGYRGVTWRNTWLAIGDSSADPLIADCGASGTPIAVALHGVGKWRPRRIAPSLAGFLHGLSAWADILCQQFDGAMLDGDRDHALKVGFVDAMRTGLERTLPTEDASAWLEYVLT